MNSGRFNGKVVLVTGGSSGIGKAVALGFAREGAAVIIAARRTAEGEAAVDSITSAGGVGRYIPADVSRAEDVERLFNTIAASFPRLDIAINNAGNAELPLPFHEQPEETFDRVMNTSVKGVWLCLKAEIARMLPNGEGTIINMSSIAGVVGTPGAAIYTASKHAVIGLTKAVALEYAKSGIRVNAICPGAVETPALRGYFDQNPEVEKMMINRHPVGRLATPEEIAASILWLASEEARFMTGQQLIIDGGYTAQ
jgi:NAD(P)-dependent dehydrogenase (short-subunit alcohol dehydrogenase family)